MLTKLINAVLLLGGTSGKKPGSLESQATESIPSTMPGAASENPSSKIKKTTNGSVVTFEGTYQGKPIRVRIFNAPTQEPNL
jgi:hypothetical protein